MPALYRAGNIAEPTSGYLAMPLRTPAQALADSLRAAERRFPVGARVRHILTLTEGEVAGLEVRGLGIVIAVRTKDGEVEDLVGCYERCPL